MVAQEQRQFDEAFQKALQIFKDTEDLHKVANAYLSLGILVAEQQQFEEAIAYFQKALQVFEDVRDFYGVADINHNLGVVALSLSKIDEAIRHLQKSLQVSEEVKDFYNAAKSCHNLGVITQEQQKWEEAIAYYEKAIQLFEELGDTWEAAKHCLLVGTICVEQGSWYKGLDYLEKSFQTYSKENDYQLLAKTTYQIARTHHLMSNFDKSRIYYRDALRIYEHIKYQQGIALCKTGLGWLMVQIGFVEDALLELEKAKEIYGELGDKLWINEVEKMINLIEQMKEKKLK
ncbi:MAG: tetratricopeptide repeat protein [Okeania sp. SIO2C9]|uniref:tetratricopeptide repeat protein n=1 Tax=Okeania sp. SIO2C9 TaxID=2607791 RepID=UPI0013C02B88|nr:tetratricopeptide repeat protein [Okeania sp. SIO2C9]NEQ75828.1 tetratricopeptide repeat protein [Okeania sp. SIO2C9]